jgi:hypothetical protein
VTRGRCAGRAGRNPVQWGVDAEGLYLVAYIGAVPGAEVTRPFSTAIDPRTWASISERRTVIRTRTWPDRRTFYGPIRRSSPTAKPLRDDSATAVCSRTVGTE